MGSSGGWHPFDRDQRYTLDDSQEATRRAAHDAQVEQMLQDLLQSFNDRDVAAIGQHLDTIEAALGKDVEGVIKLLFGGSVSKHTYVSGLSDVDMLVCINDSALAGKSPREVMAHFLEQLGGRLPNTDLHSGDLAVTVTFSDGHKIQLLPALRTATGYRIAAAGGEQWSGVVQSSRFARELTAVNQSQRGKVVPVVKLYKALNESLPKASRLTGYHIEALATEIFRSYSGRPTLKHMLRHFCTAASTRVLSPIADTTGESVYVDDYLGTAHSRIRHQASHAIGNLYRKIDSADSRASFDEWEAMFS